MRAGNWAWPDYWKTGRSTGRTHGLRATYTHGCHCDECKEAERRYKAEYRKRKANA